MLYNRNNQSYLKPLATVVLASTALLMSGCETLRNIGKSDSEIVKSYSEDWLASIMQADFENAYKYTTPAFKLVVTPKLYISRYAGAPRWTDGKVVDVVCEEENVCDVKFSFSYFQVRTMMTQTRRLDERWIKTAEGWRIYHKIK